MDIIIKLTLILKIKLPLVVYYFLQIKIVFSKGLKKQNASTWN
jgi:hypothetical protein